MEAALQDLVVSLSSTALVLRSQSQDLLQALHSTEKLPNQRIYDLAKNALDLLSEVRLALEPGQMILADHFFGHMNAKALCAAVELNVPDALSQGSMTIDQLARQCGARSDRLGQVMKILYNNGIFSYNKESQEYSNNHTSTLLLSSHWTQWRNWVDLYGNEFYDMSRGIQASCKTEATRCPAQINFDTDDSMFQYFTDRQWIAKFHKTLGGGATAQAPGIVQDYPWEEIVPGKIIDIGGGSGGLIASLLRHFKTMEGAVFDAPHVIEQARHNFHDVEGVYADVGDRVAKESLISGDFFTSVPSADVYTMKWCLHDWNDDKARTILTNIRRALVRTARSRLLVFESVLGDGHTDRLSRYADMNMMVAVGGQERSKADWEKLAGLSGWRMGRICALRNAWPCAIEFLPNDHWDTDSNSQPTSTNGVHSVGAPSSISHIEPQATVTASMRFLEPWESSRGNPYVRIAPAPGFDRTNFEWKDCSVSIANARAAKDSFQLDTHGFMFREDNISPETVQSIQNNNTADIQNKYYPQIEAMVKRETGASRVIIFDHTIRKRRLDLQTTQNDDGKEQPATMVHCDQSEKGALRRLKMNIDVGEDVDSLVAAHRVQMINIWRPLNGPVVDWPLAMLDWQTVKAGDMFPCDLLKGEFEERGQTATFVNSAGHKWYYLDKHLTNEITMIKIWDNSTEEKTSTFCGHAAFHHPNAPEHCEPRESIEVRCIAIY